MPKYSNLTELKAAYESGELDRRSFLMIDNDSMSVYERDENGEFSEEVYDGGMPTDVLEDALKILGIPYEFA